VKNRAKSGFLFLKGVSLKVFHVASSTIRRIATVADSMVLAVGEELTVLTSRQVKSVVVEIANM